MNNRRISDTMIENTGSFQQENNISKLLAYHNTLFFSNVKNINILISD